VARAFLVVELLPDLPGQGKGAAAVGHVHGEDDQDADRGADVESGMGTGRRRSSAGMVRKATEKARKSARSLCPPSCSSPSGAVAPELGNGQSGGAGGTTRSKVAEEQ
jgi:hypothetical protein